MTSRMRTIEQDIELVRDLLEWAGTNANQVAKRIGSANTTINRFVNGKATHTMARATYDKLRAAYPDYPRWPDAQPALPKSNAEIVGLEGDGIDLAQENLPVYGSGLGAPKQIDGEAVELTALNTGDVLEYVKRPAILNGKRKAYALHVQGSSMHPALPDGEMVVACRDMPLSIGDNVVVYLRDGDEDDGKRARAVLIKELVRRSATYVELRQYDPAMDFKIDMSEVVQIDRILTRREMLS